jgi:hypothetical protein
MRIQSLLASTLSVAALLFSVSASPLGEPTEPEIIVSAAFPESNVFGHVVNGEQNKIFIAVENKSNRNVTLKSVSGSFHDVNTNAIVKNASTLQYGIQLLEGTKLQLPYSFYSEFKPGDIRLNIWLDHAVDDVKYRVQAYDSIITVVEPELSIFDFKLLSTYAIVTAMLGALAYYAYATFFPQVKKPRKAAVAKVSAPVAVTASTSGGYQEEWIPEHHIKKSKTGGKKKSGVATSGDESALSGAESDAIKRRKSKK